jgi:hypothetical protein
MLLAAACLTAAVATDGAHAQAGDRSTAGKPAPAGAATTYRKLAWEDLIPPDWDPMKGVDMKEIANLQDGDPRARATLDRLRRAWDNAPTRPEMNGTRVRLPGYVVPLSSEGRNLREFLLVPYFGACVHSPPPPSNQVVHVVMERPAAGIEMMDAVWVSGRLVATSFNSGMGSASYRIDGVEVVLHR